MFTLRYGRKLKDIDALISEFQDEYQIRYVQEEHLDALTAFFQAQPEEDFKYFHPHPFDRKSLAQLQKNKAFLSFVVLKDEQITGYFFLRCYFIGKSFRGYIVDYRWRNKGISKLTAKVMTKLACHLGIPSFGTIAPENVPSMKSQNAVNDVKIIKVLESGDYFVEYCVKKD